MNSPNGIRTIFFDLDGTLRHDRPSSSQVFFDFAREQGAPVSTKSRLKALRWAHAYFADSAPLMEDRQRFKDDDSGFWRNYAQRYLEASGCDSQTASSLAPTIRKRMLTEYQPVDWIPSDVSPTLAHLQAIGYTLGVVSNRSQPVDQYLESIGLRRYLHFTLVAGDVEAWKPNPLIFQTALEQSNSSAERTLYVGDNYYADVLGARRAGLHPVLVDPDNIFPEADCPVITKLGELSAILSS